jgi:hypothetical protein
MDRFKNGQKIRVPPSLSIVGIKSALEQQANFMRAEISQESFRTRFSMVPGI